MKYGEAQVLIVSNSFQVGDSTSSINGYYKDVCFRRYEQLLSTS